MSYVGGFGRLEGGEVVPMGRDIVNTCPVQGEPPEGEPRELDDVDTLAAIPRPGKIICVGLNYRDHAAETGKPIPTEPVLFAKFANSVVGDGATVAIPAVMSEADWEAELGVVIGQDGARRVPRDRALDYVAGYLCMNDLSARDLQRSGRAVDAREGDRRIPADGAGTRDGRRGARSTATRHHRAPLNGEVVQNSNTGEMVFDRRGTRSASSARPSPWSRATA